MADDDEDGGNERGNGVAFVRRRRRRHQTLDEIRHQATGAVNLILRSPVDFMKQIHTHLVVFDCCSPRGNFLMSEVFWRKCVSGATYERNEVAAGK